ncbi:snare-dependent exocytosis protein-like protein [Myriangium duriaei CBS 260.36]|uniref:Snare-dependent exocytosis protein-like protein n=1 Tax=Myriangium duriaei CBS 260.36 TaxID=1168546 RepID=A0A9P4J6W1_9PEZI|nr:snare-dependent exocytosis protein-like protein [Myriangium duriaei CBS 260.36]
MAHLLRGKQAGIQNDLSAGITPDIFAIDDLDRFGVNSQICALAYDPVQSLLAVGTKDSQFGPGQIYVFGRQRIEARFPLPSRAAATTLNFVADKLICLDSKHELSLYSLETKRMIASHSPPGFATTLATDPMLDYALIGMQTGDILCYDMDREGVAPLRIPNLWTQYQPRARISPIVSLQFHPRDIGTLLIGYIHGAAIYSFKQNKAIKFFAYDVPPGAPGGDANPTTIDTLRRPPLTHAVWHPTGTFILTAHEDGSLVFWDPTIGKDARILQARTLADTNVNRPGAARGGMSEPGPKEPITRIAWCANQDPDDTALLIAGGTQTDLPTKGLTLFELGRTPMFNTSSWELLAKHFENPKRQRVLPTPPNAQVVDYCLVPRSSPHFAGAHDPIAILSYTTNGEMLSLSFPSGIPITPTNQLPVSLTFIHPFANYATVSAGERTKWLGMTERRSHGPDILKGGVEGPHPLKRYEDRNIIQTAHVDGTVRLWDAGHGDELENPKVLQVDVARALGRYDDVDITRTSFSGTSGELVVGSRRGEVVVFRWGHNKNHGREPSNSNVQNQPGVLTNPIDRCDPALSEGLLPFTLLNANNGPITAVKMSDVGFVAAASEGGNLVVLDLRGPAIIFNENISSIVGGSGASKGGSFRRRSTQGSVRPDFVVNLEFSVMTLEGDNYSSIALHAGTHLGHVLTFRVIPEASGRYGVQFAGSSQLEGRVIHLAPIAVNTGKPAYASQTAVGNLRSGFKVEGALIAVTPSEVRIFRPATQKGAHKSFDGAFCDGAVVARFQDQGFALVGLFGDGNARAFSIPALKEVGSARLDGILDVRRFADAMLTPSGDILGWTGPSELGLVSVFGTGQKLPKSNDQLYNPQALIPPRPAISNFQWVSGTQYVTAADMDLLIGGPDRPPSKRQIAQSRADAQQADLAARGRTATGGSSSSSAAPPPENEGYWAYMQRQLNERTEKLNIMGDSMQNLQQNSQAWSEDVGKFVTKQKRNLVFGAAKSKFGL